MEKFFELFKRDLKTERLELHILEPTQENARLVWDVLKNENPEDFRYIHYSPKYDKPLPESEAETLETMKNYADAFKNNAVLWYVFHQGQLIGFHGVAYNQENDSVGPGNVWFVKSAWGHGFNHEVQDMLEKITFEDFGAHRMSRQCMAENERSIKSIMSSGYHLDGRLREWVRHDDGTWTDHLLFSKLASEYKNQDE